MGEGDDHLLSKGVTEVKGRGVGCHRRTHLGYVVEVKMQRLNVTVSNVPVQYWVNGFSFFHCVASPFHSSVSTSTISQGVREIWTTRTTSSRGKPPGTILQTTARRSLGFLLC